MRHNTLSTLKSLVATAMIALFTLSVFTSGKYSLMCFPKQNTIQHN